MMPRGRQHVFNHPQAQREAELEPHREGNDFSGKAVATVERITGGHAPSSPIKLQVPLTLRCQFCLMGADVKHTMNVWLVCTVIRLSTYPCLFILIQVSTERGIGQSTFCYVRRYKGANVSEAGLSR